jgi:hypothetical protein
VRSSTPEPLSSPLAEVREGSRPRAVWINKEAWGLKVPDVIDTINKIALMSFGVFVIVRGRGRLALLGGLALYGLAAGAGIRAALIGVPPPLIITIHVIRQALLAGGLFCLALMSIEMLRMTIPNPAGRSRRQISTLLLLLAIATALVVLPESVFHSVVYPLQHKLTIIHAANAWPSDDQGWRLKIFPPVIAAMILPLVIMSAAVGRAPRSEAQLFRWILASSALGLSGTIFFSLWSTFGPAPDWVHDLILTEIIMGAGYAYAFVRHRLVDVAFVLNRAVILAIAGAFIAAIVVLIDSIFDPAVDVWAKASPNDNTIALLRDVIKYLLILGVGLSLHFLETPIENQIDRLLFARRYRIKEGLARLREAITGAETVDGLIHLTTSRLRRLVGARSVAVYEPRDKVLVPLLVDNEEGAGANVRPLPEDDSTIAWVRSNLAPSPSRTNSELPIAAVAFPMSVTAHFTGAVIVERHSLDEPYDPDLRALVGRFVREFAAALLFLRTVRVPHG